MSSEATITCDFPGCSKQLGEKNDHISVVANHVLATGANDGAAQSVYSGDFDFCSWDHAAKTLAEVAGPAGDARKAYLDGVEADKERAAEAERLAEAAAAAEPEVSE